MPIMMHASTFRIRKLEWQSAAILLGIGIVMMAFPQSFDLPALAAFKQWQDFWTWACLLIGGIRLGALFINGAWAGGTPTLRLLGSLLSAGVWGAFVGNLLQTTDAMHVYWGTVVYGGLMIGELASSFYSAADISLHRRR